jgi:2-methylcitrate dehydratase PrpD
MNALDVLAEFVQGTGLLDQPAERLDRIKLHVLDTCGAGAKPAEVRASEVDDIHLSSCTTPGSVIVPTALDLASRGELRLWGEFSAAVLAGYEVLIRLGFAIDGSTVLGKGVWPTYFAAPLGSAAVACRAYRLSAAQTAGALATALSFCTGTSLPAGAADSSRWFSLGTAVANGVLAANAAREGLLGSADLLERYSGRIAGVRISKSRWLGGLGRRYRFDETGCKPYPIARQALAAVEAASELAAAENIRPASITRIAVRVPSPQLRIIDHAEPPDTRMRSIASVQYQIAIALLAPERLLDLDRKPPYLDDRVRELMAKVRLEAAPHLDKHYPDAWPGQIEIRTGRRRLRHTVLYPRGDPRNPFSWEDLARKYPARAGLIEPVRRLSASDRILPFCEKLD